MSHGPGFYSKQFCCYYCRSVQWVYEDENPQLNEQLYTAFGRDAQHRQTCHVLLNNVFGLFINWLISTLFLTVCFPKSFMPRYRLVTVQEWAAVNPATPLMKVPGWSPWRVLALLYKLLAFSKPKLSFYLDFILLMLFLSFRNTSRYDASCTSGCGG